MNPTATMLRWYRMSIGQAEHRHPAYTAQEVLQLLRPDAHTDERGSRQPGVLDAVRTARSEAVHQAASQPVTWLGRMTKHQRREIGELADRLPSLVFHHAIGGDTGELVRRHGGWSTWRYERALEVAGSCIASYLNGS